MKPPSAQQDDSSTRLPLPRADPSAGSRHQQQQEQEVATTTDEENKPGAPGRPRSSPAAAAAAAAISKSSSLSDHLIKLSMFLVVAISGLTTCGWHLQLPAVHCQKNFFQHNTNHHRFQQQHHFQPPVSMTPIQQGSFHHPRHHHQLPGNHEHILISQRQALDHLMFRNQPFNQPAADRRASASQSAASSATSLAASQQQQVDPNGKLLVCYYTARNQPAQSYWPPVSEARSSYSESAGISISGLGPELRQETGFAPMLQYEPFVSSGQQVRDPQQQQQVVSSNGLEFGFVGNMKNQQQQLVFKTAVAPQSGSAANQQPNYGGRPGGGLGAQVGQQPHGGFKSSKQQQQQQYQELQVLDYHQHHQQQSPSGSSGGGQNNASQLKLAGAGGSKQTSHQPANSIFIGADLDATSIASNNNGLIVGSATFGAASPSAGQQSAGNNGFIISSGPAPGSKDGLGGGGGVNEASPASVNNGAHPERSLLSKQQQQLVFSPSLSRAFIVGGSVGVAGSSSNTNNNEALDTKSQLFIPSAPAPSSTPQQQQQHNNYYLQPQQLTTTTVSSSPLLYQAEQQQQSALRGKSLQAAAVNSEQLSPVARGFSGAVSSAPSVPLSPASSTNSAASQQPAPLQQQAGVFQRSSSTQQQQQQQQLQTPFLPSSSNQLIVGGPQVQQQQPASNSHSSTGPGKTHSWQANSLSQASSHLAELKFSAAGGDTTHHQGKSPSTSQQQASAAASSSNSPAPANQPLLHLEAGTPSSAAPSPGGLVSSSNSAPSSPLSTMFDLFGAASQYLMRFKPSAMISPGSFVFNAISPNSHHADHSNQDSSHGIKSAGGSGSANLSSVSSPLLGSSAGSLIPLPFSSSLVANLQKSTVLPSSGGSANDRSSGSSSSQSLGGSILSRFSLSQSNQRREDVCGRTIQTPQRRIIGGEGARYGEFPYQVHIKIAKHQCGGALVDKQSIVTAAHCVYHFITRAPVSKLQIVIGAYDIEDEQYQELPPQYFKVNKVKLHPNFRFSASHPDRYDIAILKLDKPVKYTDNVLPVCLPGKDLKFESMVGTVTGFGKTDPSLSNRYGTRLLQKVDVPIIENNECERWHRTRGIDLKIFPEMMCAGYEDGLKDACVGDSGGPLVVKTSAGGGGGSRWTLAGITSAGFGCAQSRQPGIYHRVSHTVDWILENLD